MSSDACDTIFETSVGYDAPDDNVNETACAEAWTAETGLEYKNSVKRDSTKENA